MKNAYFFLLALAASLFFISCSDKDDNSVNPIYGKENFYITTYVETATPGELSDVDEIVERFHLIIAFNDWGKIQMISQTYIWIEMYSDNRLKFIENTIDETGIMCISGIVFKKNENWQGKLHYPWYQLAAVTASGEGEFEFAVKFYHSYSNQTFITPHYRMKIWREKGKMKSETTLME